MSGFDRKCSLESCERAGTSQCSGCKSEFYCSREHQKEHWQVHKVTCSAKASELAAQNIVYPTSPKFLVVTGMMFDAADCFMSKSLLPKLRAKSIPTEKINFTKKSFLSKIKSGEFSTCVVFQLGSGGDDKSFFTPEIKAFLVPWVHNGGKLIINGERSVLTVFNEWFSKSWAFEGDFYRRTVHDLNPDFSSVPSLFEPVANLPPKTNCKGVMLSRVDPSEKLYVPTAGAVSASVLPMPGFAGVEIDSNMCVVAVAAAEKGRICFIGDINAEESTGNIIVAVGSA